MVDDPEGEQERQVKALCDVLNAHNVNYVVFGSFAARLQGVLLRTLDVDVVPDASVANLQKPCDAINSLQPRWRVDDVSEGLKIDGDKLEPRHILGSSIALGLVTTAGRIDVLLEPKGFERGFQDLIGSAITVNVDGTEITVGAIKDLIVSKRLLGREKDREHLPLLLLREAEIAREQGHDRGIDSGFDIGF